MAYLKTCAAVSTSITVSDRIKVAFSELLPRGDGSCVAPTCVEDGGGTGQPTSFIPLIAFHPLAHPSIPIPPAPGVPSEPAHSTMQSIKTLIWGPDPAEQLRKCNSLIRQNARQLDRQINDLKNLETKTRSQIKTASNRSANRKNTQHEVRLLARELLRVRKQHTRLNTSKAQLESVGMQVREAFAVRKIQGSMKASTEVMRNVNSLVKLPQLTGTMEMLRKELLTAQVIEEMSEDMMPAEEEFEDDEAEGEVDKIIAEIMGGKLGNAEVPVDMPEVPVAVEPVQEQNELQEWRDRLEALKS
ncbi:hypothetical protein H072_5805 [Dactylellina haptotyla CBS 200.50]|uniref:Vacuolar protein sorting-associated protein 24 n=1 Tax=Dactylellina haptotyla (strain CBS 200.50) TaxID=1284197 RepID=S8ABW5_DACHA|nr:hypothetical protein H072_5805 [Dactylellina haptotyla CBS 200.50]